MRKNEIHGLSKTKIYRKWADMIQRCNNPNSTNYENYGSKGIKVCEEWLENFLNFYYWSIDNGYVEGLSLDRINPNGNYEPLNCRWVDRETQDNNKRNSVKVIVRGEELTLAQVGKKYGFKPSCIQHRYNMGNRGEDLITPLKRGVKRDGTKQNKPEIKLSKKDVSEIKWLLHNTDLTQKEIANRFGVVQNMISKIKLNKSHIDVIQQKPDWWDDSE